MAKVVMFLKSQNWEVGLLAGLLYRPSQTAQEALPHSLFFNINILITNMY